MPFYSIKNGHEFITDSGMDAFSQWNLKYYLSDVLDMINSKNMYSLLVWLYFHFHLQGSTIRGVGAAMNVQGVFWRMPFLDGCIVDIARVMPESWGRGLNYAHTKYPLKWIIANKLDYPVDLLWGGVHSYIMEVDQRVSVPIEILYHSGLSEYFKELLSHDRYHLVLDNSVFNIRYYDEIISSYKNGDEISMGDGKNLIHLCYLLDRIMI